MGFLERRKVLAVVVLPLAIAAAALAVWSVSAPSAPPSRRRTELRRARSAPGWATS